MALNSEEVWQALDQLPDGDYQKIRIRARTLIRGLIGLTAEDLIQKTFLALLSLDRVFPGDVAPVVVVMTAMGSEASNWRERDQNGPIDQYVEVSDTPDFDEDDEGGVSVVPRSEITPERIVSGQEIFKQLTDELASEPELQDLAVAWGLGMTGQETADSLGLNVKELEAARKRLNRRLLELKEKNQ